MKFLLLAIILLASCGAALPLQTPKPAEAGKTTAAPASKTLDSAQLLEDVRVLSADSMEGRGTGTKGGAMARAYVERRMADVGLRPLGSSFEQEFKLPTGGEGKGAGRSGVNLVGYVTGRTHPERFLVVTAHYDHLGVRDGVVYNGADDNASGVAALLQLAAHFGGAHGIRRPENSIIFAALDAEEEGLLGAYALVKRLQAEKRAVALDVNLDMVSRSDRGELYAAGTYRTSALRPLLERVASRAPVKLLLGHDRPEQGHDDWTSQSDQFAFQKAGVPFIYFGVEDHKDYHKPTDDFDVLTRDFFIHAAETILDAVETLDAELDSAVRAPGRKV